ncbi:hypothetical protein [Marivita geojedonensis]|uniref:hypothetical protein n=1 Tax=Marivita geojedonensis TaxID=1123756 RepID=UPI000D4C42D5|nr:hypothetical protein [Marivita geojedonensis]PRY73911.1 hypothetical protein CLV76_12632 [Marivita geojedonensis]
MKRNEQALVILPYTHERTTISDISCIREALYRRTSDIRLFSFDSEIVPVDLANIESSKTTTFTLDSNLQPQIFDFIPGPKFFSNQKLKTELFSDLQTAGVPVPSSVFFEPDRNMELEDLGEFIAVKTTAPGTVRAKGIFVFRSMDFEKLREKILHVFKSDIQSRFMPIFQKYIETGKRPESTRVTTFLGAPIMCFKTIAPNDFFVKDIDGLVGGEATSNFSDNRMCELVNDSEMVEMASWIASLFPETCVLSIDMVRCKNTRRIYCLEVNQGNLCLLSAPLCGAVRNQLGAEALHSQFSSYDTIAQRMVEVLDHLPDQ